MWLTAHHHYHHHLTSVESTGNSTTTTLSNSILQHNNLQWSLSPTDEASNFKQTQLHNTRTYGYNGWMDGRTDARMNVPAIGSSVLSVSIVYADCAWASNIEAHLTSLKASPKKNIHFSFKHQQGNLKQAICHPKTAPQHLLLPKRKRASGAATTVLVAICS